VVALEKLYLNLEAAFQKKMRKSEYTGVVSGGAFLRLITGPIKKYPSLDGDFRFIQGWVKSAMRFPLVSPVL